MLVFFTSLALILMFVAFNPFLWAFAFTSMVALCKEICDFSNQKKHTAELADFIATVTLPAVIAFIGWYLYG